MGFTNNGSRHDALVGGYCARKRRFPVQKKLSSIRIVILSGSDAADPQMPFAKNKDEVDALAAFRQARTVGV